MQAIFISERPSVKTVVYAAAMQPGGRPTTRERSALGQRIAQARVAAGISQKQLAEKLSTSQPAIAYWERAAVNLRSDVLANIAAALGTSVDSLLGTAPTKSRVATAAPAGKVRQAFDAVSKLPRRQQDAIVKVVSALVAQATVKTTD
jgi:transcriptional regulator with XRE-family HTH domain